MWSLKNLYNYKKYALCGRHLRFKASGVTPGVNFIKIDQVDENIRHKKETVNPIEAIQKSIGIPVVETLPKGIPPSIGFPLKVEELKGKILPFEDVPGPKMTKYLSNIFKFISAAGPYFKFNNKMRFVSFLFNEYGPVVRVAGPFGGDIVLLTRPDDMQSIFKQEGSFPVHSTFDSLDYFRTNNMKRPNSGLYSVQGLGWSQQRSIWEKSFNYSMTNIRDKLNVSCNELIEMIPQITNRQNEVPADFQQKLFKWSLECMGHILFSERLGLLENQEQAQGDALWLEEALSRASEALMTCETGLQLWRGLNTPSWTQLVQNCNSLESLIGHYLRQGEISSHNARINEIKYCNTGNINENDKKIEAKECTPEDKIVVNMLLGQDKMKSDDIITSFIDMLIIGVNSSVSAMSFILYHLARGQRVQKKLYAELKSAMPTVDGNLSVEQLKKLPYLQACIKESLRLVPPIPVITRVLPTDVVVDNYEIPQGSVIVMATQVASLKEENFDNAEKFYPERWFTSEVQDFHPLATLPFGHGPRKCVGQGLAELKLLMITAKIIRKFKVEYNYGDMKPKSKLFSMANRPLRFRFVDRK